MTRLKANSRVASTQASKDVARLTEIINGVLVSKQATKSQKYLTYKYMLNLVEQHLLPV